jgi:uncharacterized membrane protein YhaH (DUF805 family)
MYFHGVIFFKEPNVNCKIMNYYIEVLRKYAVFEGRASRPEYWYFVLFNFLISLVLSFVDTMMGFTEFMPLNTIYSLGVLIPSIAVAIRRMHDVGKSGWFILIPIYNLILALTKGDDGPNEYGPDPMNPDAEMDITEHLVD